MSKKGISEIIIEQLISEGVKRIYGVVGDSLNGLLEEIRKSKHIQWIPTRHEETGAFAAGAEAALTDQLTVCAGSCGPGNMHLINGLYDCHRNRVPVLAIAAHIPAFEIGRNYFQETHPELIFNECSHFCELVSQPEQIPGLLEIAIHTAISKRGVSVLVIPGNIALQKTEVPRARTSFKYLQPEVLPPEEALIKMSHILNASKAITIFGGAGCAKAAAEIRQVSETLKAPIVSALRGKECLEFHPHYVGLTGLIGVSSGYEAIEECDTLLMLGTDFPYRQFYPEKATIVQVDIRGENIGRRTPVDLGVVGDVKATLSALQKYLTNKSEERHLQTVLKNYGQCRKDLDALSVGKPNRKPIHPQYLAKMVDELATEDAIFCCDVGTPTVWAARYLTMNGKRRLLGSFSHGSMANALPQAIGAQLTFPQRQVVTFSGDGGLAMLLGDLLTLKQLNLPVKIVLFNNSALGFVELEMKASGFLECGTELENPNFAELAKSAGIHSVNIDDPAQIKTGLQQAFAHRGPALINVMVNRQELSMPPKISMGQAINFNIWALKAVLNGEGDKLIDLAKSNLFR